MMAGPIVVGETEIRHVDTLKTKNVPWYLILLLLPGGPMYCLQYSVPLYHWLIHMMQQTQGGGIKLCNSIKAGPFGD